MKQYEKNLAETQKLALLVLIWIRDFVQKVHIFPMQRVFDWLAIKEDQSEGEDHYS
jgi:hypothetical protein